MVKSSSSILSEEAALGDLDSGGLSTKSIKTSIATDAAQDAAKDQGHAAPPVKGETVTPFKGQTALPVEGRMASTIFVLVGTSHAGNVGATARAMKVMGFDAPGSLVLVAPRWPDVLQREEAIAMASGADDVLLGARVVATLDEALLGVHQACATAMTPRDFGPPTVSPREAMPDWAKKQKVGQKVGQKLAQKLTQQNGQHPLDEGAEVGADADHRVAFVFGCERFGMSNEDVYRCHHCLQIPTAFDFGSLNLAQAVQIIAYEWRQALGGFSAQPPEMASSIVKKEDATADLGQIQGLLAQWQALMLETGFLDAGSPKKIMHRLRQWLMRSTPSHREVQMLRGMAKELSKAIEVRP